MPHHHADEPKEHQPKDDIRSPAEDSTQDAAADKKTTDATAHSDRESWPAEYQFRRWGLFVNGLLVVVGGVYSFLAYQQWQALISQQIAMKAQIQAARRATELAERAWVTVKTAALAKPLAIGESPATQIELQNTGHSPALNVTINHGVTVRDGLPHGDVSSLLPKLTIPASQAVIGPGVLNSSTSVHPVKISDTDLRSVAAGTTRAYTFGTIQYDDIFGTKHTTTFCYASLTAGNISNTLMGACSQWNTAN